MTGLLLVLSLVGCRGTRPGDTEAGPGATRPDTGDSQDTGAPDSTAPDTAADSGDSDVVPEDSGTGDTGGDTADTGEEPGPVDLDEGTRYDGRITGDEAGSAYADGARLPLATLDANGDGRADLILGLPSYSRGGTQAGATMLVEGPVVGTVSVAEARATVIATVGEFSGYSVAAGDVDGDGLDDLWIGAPEFDRHDETGAVYLLLSPLSGNVDTASADATVTGGGNEELGWRVAAPGDLDGDGLPDVAAAEFGPGYRVYLFPGSTRGATTPWEGAPTVITGGAGSDLGAWVGAAGDQDGDGADDLLVAQPGAASRQLLLFHGPLSGSLTDADADLAWSGTDYAGDASAVGDFDGDGYLDTAFMHLDDTWAFHADAVYLWYGPMTADVDVAGADASVLGESLYAGLGSSISTGDVDGDGRDELLLGAPGPLYGPGDAWLFSGPFHGTFTLADASVRFMGDGEDAAGWSTALDDMDGDGLDDVIIGAPWDDAGASMGGTVWITYATSL